MGLAWAKATQLKLTWSNSRAPHVQRDELAIRIPNLVQVFPSDVADYRKVYKAIRRLGISCQKIRQGLRGICRHRSWAMQQAAMVLKSLWHGPKQNAKQVGHLDIAQKWQFSIAMLNYQRVIGSPATSVSRLRQPCWHVASPRWAEGCWARNTQLSGDSFQSMAKELWHRRPATCHSIQPGPRTLQPFWMGPWGCFKWWPWLLVITGYFYGIIHSINEVIHIFTTNKWPQLYKWCMKYPHLLRKGWHISSIGRQLGDFSAVVTGSIRLVLAALSLHGVGESHERRQVAAKSVEKTWRAGAWPWKQGTNRELSIKIIKEWGINHQRFDSNKWWIVRPGGSANSKLIQPSNGLARYICIYICIYTCKCAIRGWSTKH